MVEAAPCPRRPPLPLSLWSAPITLDSTLLRTMTSGLGVKVGALGPDVGPKQAGVGVDVEVTGDHAGARGEFAFSFRRSWVRAQVAVAGRGQVLEARARADFLDHGDCHRLTGAMVAALGRDAGALVTQAGSGKVRRGVLKALTWQRGFEGLPSRP